MFKNGHLRWQPLSSLEHLALVVHEAALNQAPAVEPPAGAAKPVTARAGIHRAATRRGDGVNADNSIPERERPRREAGPQGKYQAMSLINERTSARNKISNDSGPRLACWQHRRRTP